MIYYILGKSSSGKDTIYHRLLQDKELKLQEITGYTTRPIRSGEMDGREYHFVTKQQMEAMEQQGMIIEKRGYLTAHGVWHYFTAKDESVNIEKENYLLIGTLESYRKVRDYFGNQWVMPFYIEVEDGLRLQRALDRERQQEKPDYYELCRRFLADSADFDEQTLQSAGITKKYENIDIEKCLKRMKAEMKVERAVDNKWK